jgi:hypothetical protein
MDEADRAGENAEVTTKGNLYKSHRVTTTATATGNCLFCDQVTAINLRWCDANCRDDWQLINGED